MFSRPNKEKETTVEEIEDAYLFGNAIYCLTILVHNHAVSLNELQARDFYTRFRTLAHRFNIDVPEQFPQKASESELEKDITYFLDYAKHRLLEKSKHLHLVCRAGETLTHLAEALKRCTDSNTRYPRPTDSAISSAIGTVQILAEEKGVDISEELNLITNLENLNKVNIQMLECRLKKKLCQIEIKKTSEKRSEIDKKMMITDDHWVISLVRLPDRETNEHAFLVVEGMTSNEAVIWFMDFVKDPKSCQQEGKIRIEHYESKDPIGSSRMLFRCQKTLMDIQRGERFLSSSWSTSKATAEKLIHNVKEQKEDPPKYLLLGHTLLVDSSAESSKKRTPHNCFTFARKMLLDLNDESIELPQDTVGKWVISATSQTLVDKQFERQKWKLYKFQLIFTILAILFIAYVIQTV